MNLFISFTGKSETCRASERQRRKAEIILQISLTPLPRLRRLDAR